MVIMWGTCESFRDAQGQVFRLPLAPIPHLFIRLIPKRRVSKAIISSLARIRFIQVSSENPFVYVVVNFLSQVSLIFLLFHLHKQTLLYPKTKEEQNYLS